ncbi:hypothetical protein [Phytohabitans rumicis]|uniref:hypothetical protein n=1 Tax=Phytohabitans rumicis TaxID=1076125 RepID=UPI0015635202|nr:hypothetical protein [Phytohabitans rumicis]
MASANPSWDPEGGVFIHHRGPDGDGYETDEDCRRDIAAIYEEHVDEFEGDIAYNFIVCRHGNIYIGRGYQRGEANAGEAGDVFGLGRNAGSTPSSASCASITPPTRRCCGRSGASSSTCARRPRSGPAS